MNTNRMVRIFAGAFVLTSLGLGAAGSPLFVSQSWLWLAVFVGANLFIPIAAGVLYPAFGLLLSPILAGATMTMSSVSVVTNALRLNRVRL